VEVWSVRDNFVQLTIWVVWVFESSG